MATIATRSTVLSIKKETTEGTPVLPAATTDFIAVQDDLAMAPEIQVLENAEMKSSLGMSKEILGMESPTVSFSHYLRASGAVATAPNFGNLLESCLGATTTAGAEYNTVAASTTSVIKVDAGEGASFQRGEALLIKDPTNGYRIRCIDSIATDDLTIGFQVPTAPGTGVNLGRAVLYYPANTGHPTLTAWGYVGNGGALQMVAGCRVTEASFSIAAGELINGSYSLEGVSYSFNPMYVATADSYIDWTDDDGTWAASIATGWYKDPHELAEALENAMNDASTETISVAYSNTTGKFTITATGTVLSLLWNSGTNTIGNLIGFSVAADDTGTAATTGYTSDNAISYAAGYTPAYDSADPLSAKDNEIMIGDASDYACFKASSCDVSISVPKTDIMSVCAESGKSGSVPNSREVTVSVSALLEQYDARMWEAYRAGNNVKFQYSFGQKSGGNWVAGKCGAIYIPTATVSAFSVVDNDGLANIQIDLKAYVNSSGEGEIFINFL